jgi:hypothetical protein
MEKNHPEGFAEAHFAADENDDPRDEAVNHARRRALNRAGERELDIAEPLYATPVNVGALSGQTKLDQVLE